MSVIQSISYAATAAESKSMDYSQAQHSDAQSLQRAMKNHLPNSNSTQLWLAQSNSEPDRPEEFQSEIFDRLWQIPEFKNANWAALKANRLSALAVWLNEGMPSVTKYGSNTSQYISEAGQILGAGTITEFRKVIKKMLQKPMQRPAELQDSFFDTLWSDARVNGNEWANIKAADRRIFAGWFSEGMPETLTSHQRKRVSAVAKTMGLTNTTQARVEFWLYLPAEMRRPDEFKDSSLDGLWEVKQIQNFNWMSISAGKRQKFANWYQEGMPPHQLGEEHQQRNTLNEISKALAYGDRESMRNDILSKSEIETAWRPPELSDSRYDQLWTQIASLPVNWSELTVVKRQAFAEWLQQGMPILSGFEKSFHIRQLARQMNFDGDANQMRKQFWQHIPSEWRRPLALRDKAFDSVWENESIQKLDWAKLQYRHGLSDSTAADSFAQWLQEGMPQWPDISKIKAEHLLTIARELGFNNRREMEFAFKRWLPADFGGVGFRESTGLQEFTNPAFPILWEQASLRDFDWAHQSKPEDRKALNDWLNANMPGMDKLPILQSATINGLAHLFGYEGGNQMQERWQSFLGANSRRPFAFQGAAFDALWANPTFMNSLRWDDLELNQAALLNGFVDWVNKGFPPMKSLKSQQQSYNTKIATMMGFANTMEMRAALKPIVQNAKPPTERVEEPTANYQASANYTPPDAVYNTVFSILMNDSDFKGRIVSAKLSTEEIQTFLTWLQQGVPGTKSQGNYELSPAIDLAQRLNFKNIDEMRKESLKLLSEKPQWPAEFFSPAFTMARAEKRFAKRSWVLGFVSPENIRIFSQWVNGGMVDPALSDNPQTINALTDIATLLGFKNFKSMYDLLKQSIPAGQRNALRQGQELFAGFGSLTLAERHQAYTDIVELAERHNVDLTSAETEALLIEVEFGIIPAALNEALKINDNTIDWRINLAADKFRRSPEQFPNTQSFNDFILRSLQHTQALTHLAQQRGTFLKGNEIDALLAAYHAGEKESGQINAWKNTPLSPSEYDRGLQSGLSKLKATLAEFLFAFETHLEKKQTAYEIDLVVTPQAEYFFGINTEININNLKPDGPVNNRLTGIGPGESTGNNTGNKHSFNPNGLIDKDGSQAGHGNGDKNGGPITAVADDAPEPEQPFKVINGQVDVSGVLLRELDLSNTAVQQNQSLFGIPVGLPESTAAQTENAAQPETPIADTSSETVEQGAPQSGGLTVGGQLGSPGDAEKARQRMEELFGKGWSQGVRPDLFPTPIDPRVPGFGEGLPKPDLNSYNTGWGLPGVKINIENESFPEQDQQLHDILRPNGEAGPAFIFPPGTEHDHLPNIKQIQQALPELQTISYAQFSQLGAEDQQQLIPRALEYQRLSPQQKSNTGLIQYLDSRLTSDNQRRQLQQAGAEHKVRQTEQQLIKSRSELQNSTLEMINARIKALQANTTAIEQNTETINSYNSQVQSALNSLPAEPLAAAFIKANINSDKAPPTLNSMPATEATTQATVIPRFIVIRTANGPRLAENLPNGQTQTLPFLIPGNTAITRQNSNGAWLNVPDPYEIGAKNLLDTLLLQSAVKMLNGGQAITPPDLNNATPQTIQQPVF